MREISCGQHASHPLTQVLFKAFWLMYPSLLCHNSIYEWILTKALKLAIKDLPCKQYRAPVFVPLIISLEPLISFHDPFVKESIISMLSISPAANKLFLMLGTYLTSCKPTHYYHHIEYHPL